MSWHSHEPPPLREALSKRGVLIGARLGDVLHPHVLVVAGARWDNDRTRMVLTRLELELVAAIPGNLAALTDLLSAILPQARLRSAEGLGPFELALDCSRDQLGYLPIQERCAIGYMQLTTTHARRLPSIPFLSVGRQNLLSALRAQMTRTGVLSVREPLPQDPERPDPRAWSRSKVREALAAATTRPPAEEEDGYVSDTTTSDDVALTVAMVAMRADEGTPGPYVEEAIYVDA